MSQPKSNEEVVEKYAVGTDQRGRKWIEDKDALLMVDEILHQQLQKAREEERERIIKLIDWRGKGFHSGSEVVAWIDEQLKTLNHSELDQAEPEGGLVDNK